MDDRPGGSLGGSTGLVGRVDEVRQRVLASPPAQVVREQVRARGPGLLDRAKGLAAESLVRRVGVRRDGRTLVGFPLAVGIGAALLAPRLAALAMAAALLTGCTVSPERDDGPA
jgi:hypothetical protein